MNELGSQIGGSLNAPSVGYGQPEDEREGEIIVLARRVQKIRAMARDLRDDLYVTNSRLYGERPETQKEEKLRPCRSGCLGELQDVVDDLESFIGDELKEEVARFRAL